MARKKMYMQLFILFGIAALILAFVVSFFQKRQELRQDALFPKGELSAEREPVKESDYEAEFSHTVISPSQTHQLAVPEDVSYSGDVLYFNEADVFYTISEIIPSDYTVETGVMSAASIDAIDIPSVECEERVIEKGYLRDNQVVYRAGIAECKYKIVKEGFYYISYEVRHTSERHMFLIAILQDINELETARNRLKGIVQSILPVKEDTTGSDDAGIEEKGTYIDSFEFFVREEKVDTCLVYAWENDHVNPNNIYLEMSDGTIIEPSEYKSGAVAFYLDAVGVGTHFVKVETYEMLYGCSVGFMDKELFEEMYP